jgi:hypothetical protein
MYKFYVILYFVLKNNHNLKSFKNMIITLNFNFLYRTHYDPFTSNKWLLKFEISEIIFWTFKNFKYYNFKIMSVFHLWMVSYHHFKIFPSSFYISKVLSLVFYKLILGVKIQKSFTKTNSIVKLSYLKKNSSALI